MNQHLLFHLCLFLAWCELVVNAPIPSPGFVNAAATAAKGAGNFAVDMGRATIEGIGNAASWTAQKASSGFNKLRPGTTVAAKQSKEVAEPGAGSTILRNVDSGKDTKLPDFSPSSKPEGPPVITKEAAENTDTKVLSMGEDGKNVNPETAPAITKEAAENVDPRLPTVGKDGKITPGTEPVTSYRKAYQKEYDRIFDANTAELTAKTPKSNGLNLIRWPKVIRKMFGNPKFMNPVRKEPGVMSFVEKLYRAPQKIKIALAQLKSQRELTKAQRLVDAGHVQAAEPHFAKSVEALEKNKALRTSWIEAVGKDYDVTRSYFRYYKYMKLFRMHKIGIGNAEKILAKDAASAQKLASKSGAGVEKVAAQSDSGVPIIADNAQTVGSKAGGGAEQAAGGVPIITDNAQTVGSKAGGGAEQVASQSDSGVESKEVLRITNGEGSPAVEAPPTEKVTWNPPVVETDMEKIQSLFPQTVKRTNPDGRP